MLKVIYSEMLIFIALSVETVAYNSTEAFSKTSKEDAQRTVQICVIFIICNVPSS